MGIDCWHVLKIPLNFTELFSPFLAPYRVICLPWFHSDLSNSPILKKKVMLYKHSCRAEWGQKCLCETSSDSILSSSSTPLGKALVSGNVCPQLLAVLFFFNYFTEVWLTYLLYWGMTDISFIMNSKNMACHFTLLIPSSIVLQMSYNGHFNSDGWGELSKKKQVQTCL